MMMMDPNSQTETPTEPYSGLEEELILRDHLAAGRTDLANERTLLAYVRTALAVFAAGVTLVHFFDSVWLEIVGWMFIPIGIVTLVVGIRRFQAMRRRIASMRNDAPKAG
jgi:putative membrane protein